MNATRQDIVSKKLERSQEGTKVNRITRLLVTVGLSTVAVLVVACSNGEAATTATPDEPSPAAAVSAPAPPSGGAKPSAPSNQPSESAPSVGAPEPETPAVSVLPSSSPPLPPARSETPAGLRP